MPLYNIFNGCGTKIKFLCISEATRGQQECVMKPSKNVSKRKDCKSAILEIQLKTSRKLDLRW